MSDPVLTSLQRNELPALKDAYENAHQAYYAARKKNDREAMLAALFDIDRFGNRLREWYATHV